MKRNPWTKIKQTIDAVSFLCFGKSCIHEVSSILFSLVTGKECSEEQFWTPLLAFSQFSTPWIWCSALMLFLAFRRERVLAVTWHNLYLVTLDQSKLHAAFATSYFLSPLEAGKPVNRFASLTTVYTINSHLDCCSATTLSDSCHSKQLKFMPKGFSLFCWISFYSSKWSLYVLFPLLLEIHNFSIHLHPAGLIFIRLFSLLE